MLAQLSSFADRWLELFGYVILQNTLFLGVIFLVLYLLRDKNAQVKYAVAALGVIKLLVPPFIPFTLRQSVAVAPAVGTFEMSDISVASDFNPGMTGPTISFLSILFLIWSGTILLMISSTLISTLRLRWHLRGSTFVKKSTIDGLTVDIFCSPNISVPMSIGLRPKRVFVPLLWSSLTDDLQHSLLRHEVAHIKRWDGLTHALQILANALYFFHPLVWILSERMNEYREMACDDMAVEDSEVSPIVYSRCLVHVAEHMLPSWSCSSASTLIKQKNKLYHRVNYQVKETKMKKLSKHRSRLIWTLLLVLIVPLSWYCKQPNATVGLNKSDTVKISGIITDFETGEPLAGANIYMPQTGQGAASNLKGEYFIIGVKPGKHDIVCSVMGYKKSIAKDFKIPSDYLYKLNFKLVPAVIQGERVIISAKEAKDMGLELATPMSPAEPKVPAAPVEPNDDFKFVPYDTPPQPIGGFEAISKYLVYPEFPLKEGIEGVVVLNVHILKSGKVGEVKILKSAEAIDFNIAAMEAVKKTKWTPAKQRDKNVAVWLSIPVEFRLEDEKE